MNLQMKRVDFENGTITSNILGASLPMLVAQILSLLYNIVDRIYIARIPHIGTAALGAVGLCFPVIVIITAFSNLFGSGGAPLFSIYRGKGEPQRAANVMNTSFTMVCVCAVVLMAVGFIFARPLLVLFGASTDALVYAYPYLMIYLIGTLPSMIATGMNPFINAQGYSTIGMTSVAVGAVANLLLDPLFIFVLDMGKPVKILDLARNMIRLSGYEPDVDIQIKYIGLRPGEKLYEELLVNTEELDKTENSLIFIERDEPIDRHELAVKLSIPKKACLGGEDDEAKEALHQAVPTFHRPEEVNAEAQKAKEMKVAATV